MSQSECENTGSNSSNQSKKRSINLERERVTDCGRSFSFVMVNSSCPLAMDFDYQKLSFLLLENRFLNINERDVRDMENQKGKAFWDHITSYHKNGECRCMVGKALAQGLRDRGPAVIPNEYERAEWKRMDDAMSGQPVRQICGPSASAMTSETSRKRLRIMVSEYSLYNNASKKINFKSQSEKLVYICNYFKIQGGMNVNVITKLCKTPSLLPVVLEFSETELIGWLEEISTKEEFDSWHAHWIAS